MRNHFMTLWTTARAPIGTLLLAALLAASGCAVPKHMGVRSGLDPGNQDKEVRFRTTYYFRIVDLCVSKPNVEKVEQDSLYRFRMTGKAGALANKVRFESGVLHKDQIDPFGAAVDFDEETGRFEARSPQQARFEELRQLIELHQAAMAELDLDTDGGKAAKKSLDRQFEELMNQAVAALKLPQQTGAGPQVGCPQGTTGRRGFQVLGPQGITTFDPDSRLIMAMTSSAKPLISTLQELSSRILGPPASSAESLLPLVQEQLNLSRAEQEFLRQRSADREGKKAKDALEAILKAFDPAFDPETAANENPDVKKDRIGKGQSGDANPILPSKGTQPDSDPQGGVRL